MVEAATQTDLQAVQRASEGTEADLDLIQQQFQRASEGLKRFVRERPVPAFFWLLGAAAGLGYVLGRVTRR